MSEEIATLKLKVESVEKERNVLILDGERQKNEYIMLKERFTSI